MTTSEELIDSLEWWGGKAEYQPENRLIITTYNEPAYTEKIRKHIVNDQIVEERLPQNGDVINYTYLSSDPGDLLVALVSARYFMARSVLRLTSDDDRGLWQNRLREAEFDMRVAQQEREVEVVTEWIADGGGPGGEDVEFLKKRLEGANERLDRIHGRPVWSLKRSV